MGLVFAYALNTSRKPILAVFRFLLPAAAVVLVWCFRGFLLSGAPLYPSTIGYVDVEWAVPIEKITEEANSVYSWARQPGALPRTVLGNWAWFGPWASRLNVGVVYHLFLSVIFCTVAASIRLFATKRTAWRYLEWIVLLPIIIGLGFWFFTAPDHRFALALFWCLSLGTALLFLNAVQGLLTRRAFVGVFCCVFVAANLDFAGYAIVNRDVILDVSYSGWHSVKAVRLIEKKTHSGLVVFVPESGVQSWDSPLPSTPYFNPDLRLRVPGKLGSGFSVTNSQKNLR
jgi:hypothetical protein